MTSADTARAVAWHLDRPRRCQHAVIYSVLWIRSRPYQCTRRATHAVLLDCSAGHTTWAYTCDLCLADPAPISCRSCGVTTTRTATVPLGRSTT